MKWITTGETQYKVGQVDDEIIADARKAGLSEAGIEALESGDRATYKQELDKLSRANPGSIWACTAGYTLWFNSAPEGERNADYKQIEWELDAIADNAPGSLKICLRCGHSWKTIAPGSPDVCPRCKSKYWNRPRQSAGKEEK